MKKNAMTLFIAEDLNSQRVRMALAEKSITADVVPVDPSAPPEFLMELSPEGTLPLLVDRELVLDFASVISEYLDERFPHPPLLPVYPVARARSRMLIGQIVDEWYPMIEKMGNTVDDKVITAVTNAIYSIVPLLEDSTYFLSNEFSLVDCAMAPLLWRLKSYNVSIEEHSPLLKRYCQNIFSRDSFQVSLSEHDIHAGVLDEIE
jgi:RNA polymerase-associated protein